MYTKKVSYKQALKQAISEWDTSKTVDVKGPMLDAIISYRGDGELPVYKDAASILERYYFNEQEDKPLEYDPMEDSGDLNSDEMEHAEGTGTSQAGTSDEKSIAGMKDEHEEEIAKEMHSIFNQKDERKPVKETTSIKEAKRNIELWFSEQEKEHDEDKETPDDEAAESAETQEEEKAEGKEKHLDVDEEMDNKKITESMENAIIEKLIDEMESMTYTGAGVKPGMEAKDEKESSDPEEHATGAGTEQAGTGDSEGQIPDRKDLADKMVDAKEYTDEWLSLMEQELEKEDESEEAKEDEEDEEDKEDKEDEDKKKDVTKEGFPIGPTSDRKAGDKDEEKLYEMNALKRAFRIFEEEIQSDEEIEKEEKDKEKKDSEDIK
jgi:hypothetical protein